MTYERGVVENFQFIDETTDYEGLCKETTFSHHHFGR